MQQALNLYFLLFVCLWIFFLTKFCRAAPVETSHVISYLKSVLTGFCMTIFSEIGDKTFFISALLAMKYEWIFVFLGSSSGLLLMTLISVLLGVSLVHIITPFYANFLGTILFFYFAFSNFYEMNQIGNTNVAEEFQQKVIEFKEIPEMQSDSDMKHDNLCKTKGHPSPFNIKPKFMDYKNSIFFQAFYMVTLAEWGDKSQIATIALAASNNSLCIGVGVFAGHVACCALAVLCGQFFSKYVNEYIVLLLSGVLFLCFGFWYALTLF